MSKRVHEMASIPERSTKDEITRVLLEAGCLWVDFNVSVSRGRSKADAVGYSFKEGAKTAAVVVEIKLSMDLSDMKQPFTYAQVLGAAHCAVTDGMHWAWYRRENGQWRHLPSAPSFSYPQEAPDPNQMQSVLWHCTEELGAVSDNPKLLLMRLVYLLGQWSLNEKQSGGLTRLAHEPISVIEKVAGACSVNWTDWIASNTDTHSLSNVVRILAGAGVGKLSPDLLYETVLTPLYEERRRGGLGKHMTNPAVAVVIAELLDKLTPHEGHVLDPAVGVGSVLGALALRRPDINMVGIDPYPNVWLPGQMVARGMAVSIQLFQDDILLNDPKNLVQNSHQRQYGFDTVFVDPPIDQRLPVERIGRWFELAQDRSSVSSEALFLEVALSALRPGGYVVMTMPPGLLHRQYDKLARQYLLREAYPELIAELPPLSPAFTALPSVLLVARKKGAGVTPTPEVLMAMKSGGSRDDTAQALREVVDEFLTNFEQRKE